jgi:hypothetical protein
LPLTPQGPPTPPPSGLGGTCPRCGTPFEPLQEYCLNCGLRLPVAVGAVSSLAAAWKSQLRWYPGDWIWPVLALLVIAAAGGTASYLVNRSERGDGKTIVATTSSGNTTTSENTTTQTGTAPTTTEGTGTVPTIGPPPSPPPPPPPSPPPSPPPPPPPPPAPSGPINWPSGKSGYTVILRSIPTSEGHDVAVTEARRAIKAGLGDVGVLNSSNFSSLHPGYYVVFSGVYGSLAGARGNLPNAARSGFRGSYTRRVTP